MKRNSRRVRQVRQVRQVRHSDGDRGGDNNGDGIVHGRFARSARGQLKFEEEFEASEAS